MKRKKKQNLGVFLKKNKAQGHYISGLVVGLTLSASLIGENSKGRCSMRTTSPLYSTTLNLYHRASSRIKRLDFQFENLLVWA